MNASRTMDENMLDDDDWQAIQACEASFKDIVANRAYRDVPACMAQ
jgi:hypothetical protein